MNRGELLHRVQEATGPDRELDCILYAFVTGFETIEEMASGAILARPPAGEPSIVGFIDPGISNRWFSAADDWAKTPEFTGSVDAIMKLIEGILPGSAPEFIRTALSEMSKRFEWHMSPVRPGQMDMLPLALCAVFLSVVERTSFSVAVHDE